MTCRSTSLCSTSPIPTSLVPRTTSVRISRMRSFADAMRMPPMLSRPSARRSLKNSVALSRNSSSAGPTTFCPSTVRIRYSVTAMLTRAEFSCFQSQSSTNKSYSADRPNCNSRSTGCSSRRPRSRRCCVERTPNPSRRSMFSRSSVITQSYSIFLVTCVARRSCFPRISTEQEVVRVTRVATQSSTVNGAGNSKSSRGKSSWWPQLAHTDSACHRFLHRIHTETNDKIVLISNYTQTLDLFEKLLRCKKWVIGLAPCMTMYAC